MIIYHIAKHRDWEAAQEAGEYRTASLDGEGFIHCSTVEQVIDVANSFYLGQRGLVLLKIEVARLAAPMIWEPPAHPPGSMQPRAQSGDLFPHLYGPLNLDAVVAVAEFTPGPDGRFNLPAST